MLKNLCAVLTFAFVALSAAAAPADIDMGKPKPGEVVVIAHRSCWKETSENSLAGVRACLAAGVDGVEFDVRHTSDGVAVIMHDETVDRMTDGSGKVSDLTFAQVKALHLRAGRGGPDSPLTDQRVPTLQEYLAATEKRLFLVFDVKDGTQRESFALAKQMGLTRQAIFFYECHSGLLRQNIEPFWNETNIFPISFDTDGSFSKAMNACPSHPENLAHVKFTHGDYLAEGAALAKAKNERVWIATMFAQDVAGEGDAQAVLHPDAVWGRFIAEGANMIMTNEPVALRGYLAGRRSAD